MKSPKAFDPLWVISFDHSIKGTIRDKAFFCISFPHQTLPENLTESEQFALDFLSEISKSFKKIAEDYFKQGYLDMNQNEQADEIREKFKSFDLWIQWLQKWQNEQKDSRPDEEKP